MRQAVTTAGVPLEWLMHRHESDVDHFVDDLYYDNPAMGRR